MKIQNGLSERAVEQETSKYCEKCGNEQLLLERTLNVKVCTDCDRIIVWKLSKDQKTIM